MTPKQTELLQRIQAFQFDAPDTSYTFADRLAKENGWSAPYAERAVEEYRRFAFLAAAAGHPVSPSEVVDQVWHQHLIFTRSYWQAFCGQTLRTELHHEPSTGGAAEKAKFADWYARTLDSYRSILGEEPPADIWPAPAERAEKPEAFRRVDLSRHWVVPKGGWPTRVAASVLIALLLVLAAGCGGATNPPPSRWSDSINPFDFTGPQFLAFYAVAFVVACGLAWRIRSSARGPSDLLPKPPPVDAYEAAYLNGGPVLATNAAITRLVERGVLSVDHTTARLRRVPMAAGANGLHPLEGAVCAGTDMTSATHVRDVRKAATLELSRIDRKLRAAGLIVADAPAGNARLLATLVALTVPAVGLIKILVGLDRSRPVEFLVVATVVSGVLALVLFARKLHRTRRGDRVLKGMKATHAHLRARPAALHGDALPLGIALFGLPVLAHTPHASLQSTLQPPTSSGTGGDSSSGGCGGGSGSGGGGSGCGGGGCGGCGGGGGD